MWVHVAQPKVFTVPLHLCLYCWTDKRRRIKHNVWWYNLPVIRFQTATANTARATNENSGVQWKQQYKKTPNPRLVSTYSTTIRASLQIKSTETCTERHAQQLYYIKQHSHIAYRFHSGAWFRRGQDVELLPGMKKIGKRCGEMDGRIRLWEKQRDLMVVQIMNRFKSSTVEFKKN